VSAVHPDSQLEQAKAWVYGLNGIGLTGSLIREVFAAFLLLRWADYQDAEQEAMAVFEDRSFSPVLPARLQWRSWCDLDPIKMGLIVAELGSHFDRLRDSRENSLATYLHALAEPMRRISEVNFAYLADVVHWFDKQPFETANDRRELLRCFDEVLTETASGYDGQFVSPSSIAGLVAAIADPRPGERVYDPCFGSAGFLTAAWERATRAVQLGPNRRSEPVLDVYGVEINASIFLVGLTRLILAGVSNPHLEHGNSLEREPLSSLSRDGFDVILANPPIGTGSSREPQRYQHFPILTRDSAGLFIQHALSQLRPKGRAVIAVPEGFLFRSGPEQELRQYLVESGQLEAVIALPEGVYLPHTSVRGCLLLLRKEGQLDRVRMVDATSFFEKAKGTRALNIRPQMIPNLVALITGTANPHATAKRVAIAAAIGAGTILPIVGSLIGAGVGALAPEILKGSRNVWEQTVSDLSAVAWDLTPRRREKGGLEILLATIEESVRTSSQLRPISEFAVRPLVECATVLAGRSIPARNLIDTPEGEGPIPYIRIKDIQKGVAGKGGHWVAARELPGIVPDWKLHAGDILLSKSGTIGKVGVVRNGAVGGIASSGLYVIRVDQDYLDPHFLQAYLGSAECQNWLRSQSRGAVIQHLNRQALEKLPVPLPPLDLQRRAVAQFRENGTDVLQFLVQVLQATKQDPIDIWVSESLAKLPASVEALTDPLQFTLIEILCGSVRTLRNKVAHGEVDSQLGGWLTAFAGSVSVLSGVGQLPKGPALLSLLTETSRNLRTVNESIRVGTSSESQARELTERLVKWLERAADALMSEVNLEITADTGLFPVGEMLETVVLVKNKGALPVRDMVVSSNPDWGHLNIGFFAEGQSTKISLRGESPKVTGSFTLVLSWTARRLDGHMLSGQRQISFEIVEAAAKEARSPELGGSPYVTGSPVEPSRNDVFFGRQELLQQITRQILHSGNVVLLEGNRRAGKTSILMHLEGKNAIPGWLGVYCSLQGAEGTGVAGVPTAEVFRVIASCIAKAVNKLGFDTPLPNGQTFAAGAQSLGVAKSCREGISEDSPFSDFREYLEVMLVLLQERALGMVLMLDEFDKLQEGITNGVTSPQVPENIRFLVQTYPRFSAILTGSRRLKKMREEYWSALYGLGTRFGVTALAREDARRLVTEPVKGKLVYSDEAVDRAVDVSAGQPYLLQCLCNRIFDLSAQRKTRSITSDMVDQACTVFVKDNEHFASLWDYAESDRRRLILMLCSQRTGSEELLSYSELGELLAQRGVEVAEELLEADLEFLRELELIDLVGEMGDGHYQLAIPLMGPWIKQQQDFDVVLSRAIAESEDESNA
jgi:type I restriction enzyme M protein